ncbi:MAG: hypothetical protein JWP11_2490, partial [Frankiales bacterium]|nr:hypothetical protein [Frankiales bacterium]
MSELPELPRVPRRVRPLPAGGIDAAVRAGRRRRNRAAVAAGGSVTAVALVVAVALVAPGSHDETLQPAHPTPISRQ